MTAATDVLIVGAGPTGLALAAQLRAFGTAVRIVERRRTPTRPSRALVVQPRTLEVLRPTGVSAGLLAVGDPDATARMHLGRTAVTVAMRDDGLRGTAFPFLLLLRQAEVERVLRDHLRERGVDVEWGTEFVGSRTRPDGVRAELRRDDGTVEHADAAWLAGCDGADSAVRRDAGIGFAGAAYRQSVLLADVDIDADLVAARGHVFVSPRGGLVLLDVGEHATWRVIAVRGRRDRDAGPADPDHVARRVAVETGGRVTVRRVAWISDIPQQRRLADRLLAGRTVLVGDAAHVHTPAGARGMNTGLQDAANLGWKLAVAARGGDARVLDSYAAERRPAALRSMLLTHLLFQAEAADHPLLRRARAAVAPFAVPLAVGLPLLRRVGLRIIGQLTVGYPPGPVAVEGDPRVHGGIPAGARLPDFALLRDGAPCRVHDLLATPGFHVLLCGSSQGWSHVDIADLRRRLGDLVAVHRLGARPIDGQAYDPRGPVLRRLGARRGPAQYLVRPDGHVGFRCAGADPDALVAHVRALGASTPAALSG